MDKKEKSFISYSIDRHGELEIEDLYVAPSERGNKKGYRLIDEAIRYASENNIGTISLYANPLDDSITEEALIEYYKEYGFESNPNHDNLMYYYM